MQHDLLSSLRAIQQYIQTLPSVTTMKPSSTSSSSSSSVIQQENKILTYQLTLLHFIVETLGISQSCQLYSNCKNFQDCQILRDNMKQLNGKIKKLSKENGLMKKQYEKVKQQKEKEEKEKRALMKKAQIFEKKVSEYERMGGTTRINSLKDRIKEESAKYEQLVRQNKKCKQQINKLNSRCKILQDLNTQTETNICHFLLNENKSISRQSTSNNKCANKSGDRSLNNSVNNKQEKEKENDRNADNKGHHKIQVMALKQQIRQLKHRISQLQIQNQNQKVNHHNKQKIYSQIVSNATRSQVV